MALKTLSAYELFDLQETISERLPDGLLPAITTANRNGELSDLLRLLGMSDLIGDEGIEVRPTRVIVMGDSVVKESKLRSIVRKNGFDPDLFDFALGYNELKHYDFSRLRDTYTYRAVMAGPMPHSTPGKRDASSTIAEMEAHPDIYPPVIRLKDSNGLKITNNSFARGLDTLRTLP